MKNANYVFGLVALFLLSISTLFAQTAQTPKDGFDLTVSSSKLSLQAGSSETLGVEIIRSKRFSKTKIEILGTNVSKGFQVNVVPSSASADSFTVTITASEGVAEGNYSFTLMGKSDFLRKGKLIELTVVNGVSAPKIENK